MVLERERLVSYPLADYSSRNGSEDDIRPLRSSTSHSDSLHNKDKKQQDVFIKSIPSDEDDDSDLEMGKRYDEDELDDSPNPFLNDDATTNFYVQLYEKSNYECRHVFNADLTWTKGEERRVVGKLDYRIAFYGCMLFVALELSRSNLQQAISDDFLSDLELSTNDYNLGSTIFLVCFLLGEIPSSVASKWIGVDRFIPCQIICWSLVGMYQSLITGRKTFFLCRGLTACCMSGLIPEIVTSMSAYYKGNELSVRLSWFWTTSALVQIVTSLASMAILQLRGLFGWEGWRFLFLIVNGVSLCIGICSRWMLVPSAVETKSRHYPQGWFTNREIDIIVNRVLRDDPSKGDMNNRQGLSWHSFTVAFFDYDLWPIFILGLVAFIPMNVVGGYLNITMLHLGWTTSQINLMSIPRQGLRILLLLQITKLSARYNQRATMGLIYSMWLVPLVVILNFWSGSMVDAWGTWVLCTLIVGAPYIHAICVSWVSSNAGSIKTRAVASAMYNIMVQLGSVVGANIYREDDAPLYPRGNKHILIVTLSLVPLIMAIKGYYTWRNHQKSKKWDSMTHEEQEWYINNTKDVGNKRLDFRFDS